MDVVELSPAQEGLTALFRDGDAYMARLYPAESNHMTDLSALAKVNVTLVGILQHGKPVACGALVRRSDGSAELKRMYVRERSRGRGYGKKILRALIAIADTEGVVLLLETGIHQSAAIELYRSHGFVDAQPFEPYSPDPMSIFLRRSRLELTDHGPTNPENGLVNESIVAVSRRRSPQTVRQGANHGAPNDRP